MEPKHLSIARRYLGEHEIAGQADNATIVSFFKRSSGAVQKDETPWCAAFVGSCLVEAGLKGTGKLNARSYLNWGKQLVTPVLGCIVVFRRGNSAWQGHVAFWLKEEAGYVTILGGNQSDAVTIARYPKSKVLGYRWPEEVEVTAKASPSNDVLAVQKRLIALGYSEVGEADGEMGTRTRGALLAFKSDNGLPLDDSMDSKTMSALMTAPHRVTSVNRTAATMKELKVKGSETIKQADSVTAAGQTIAVVGGGAGVAKGTGLLDQLTSYSTYIEPLKNVWELVGQYWWVAAIGVGLYLWRSGYIIKVRRWIDHISGNHTGR